MKESVFTGKRVALLSLGCKVNSYETEAMTELFLSAGAVITEFGEGADIYIINTCSVTNIADRKSRQMLHKAKQKNAEAIVVAVGCYAQIAGEKLLSDSAVDIVIGNEKKSRIIDYIAEYIESNENLRCAGGPLKKTDYDDMFISSAGEKCRAYIKIEDGCNQFCSYCIIPYARGRVRSRSARSTVEEVKALAAQGYKEIVLTGIHLSSYGIDEYEQQSFDRAFRHEPLLNLINKVSEVEGIERIRLGSLEPRIISADFVKALAENEKVCPHFHLSLQSGCDSVLERMNRHYCAEEYFERCCTIREFYKNPGITTDVIVGFPGETDEEFEASEAFLRRVGFSKMHIFKYSRRAGTKADKMPGQVAEELKHARSERLLQLNNELQRSYLESFIGGVEKVLTEETVSINGEEYMTGYNERYARIAVRRENGMDVNRIINVRVTGIQNSELMLAESYI